MIRSSAATSRAVLCEMEKRPQYDVVCRGRRAVKVQSLNLSRSQAKRTHSRISDLGSWDNEQRPNGLEGIGRECGVLEVSGGGKGV